jgi:hypothetical protein
MVFEAVLYDIQGNIIDVVRHQEVDMKANASRCIVIAYKGTGSIMVVNYDVRLIKAVTAKWRKIQILRHEIRTTESGEEEIKELSKIYATLEPMPLLLFPFTILKKIT